MTPRQFAEAECCNAMKGICVGCGWQVADNGRFVPVALGTEGNPCLVAAKSRCKFFEQAVLPAATAPTKEAYHAQFADWKATRQRLGKCGHPVEKGHRYCAACLRLRLRESYRKSKRRTRGSDVQFPES